MPPTGSADETAGGTAACKKQFTARTLLVSIDVPPNLHTVQRIFRGVIPGPTKTRAPFYFTQFARFAHDRSVRSYESGCCRGRLTASFSDHLDDDSCFFHHRKLPML
ncbi:hypothetical protein BST61_g3260 [Cercospora zeina]